jgi:predicted SAM-dependent methyltransferase
MGLGLGLHVRAVRLLERLGRWRRQRARVELVRRRVERLHIGCGPQALPGWTNVDIEWFPGVDVVRDVRDGLPFHDVAYVYAEHFIEHLTYDEALRFFKECRAALRDDGVLRVSTPNLDWVLETHYRGPDRVDICFALNKAFRGWGHRFLYNEETLTATLQAAGFADVRFAAHGKSDDPVLTGIERHETYPDEPGMPHVLVAEARGRRAAGTGELERAIDEYDRALRS